MVCKVAPVGALEKPQSSGPMALSKKNQANSVCDSKRESAFALKVPAVEDLDAAKPRVDVSERKREFRKLMDVSSHYLEEVRRQFRGHKKLGEGAMSQLRDEEFFVTLDPESNSVALVVKHLAGNMRSRFTDFLTTDGEKPDRNRDQEFEIAESSTRPQFMLLWEEGWNVVFSAVDGLQPDDLMRTVTIRQQPHTVLQALNRQLAHYAYHVGQIVFLAKHLRSQDWKSLSVPRGKSEEFNRQMSEKHK